MTPILDKPQSYHAANMGIGIGIVSVFISVCSVLLWFDKHMSSYLLWFYYACFMVFLRSLRSNTEAKNNQRMCIVNTTTIQPQYKEIATNMHRISNDYA
ncbi:hypothetical protein [Plebeiibacterium marinum]|uniref:Uncharacterized protein n=1 Tax=Plebeiibacterium marinum TaxID=2992111 RepID=A0AAE3MBI3_9BACT|nr:hypothetical protein [Plebeiobacterium marinum]MCW3804509.1 hypothetical protein [Plebeiobacterium marinum]